MSLPSTGSLAATYPPPAATLGRLILDRVAATPNGEALRGPLPDGGWRSWTWREVGDEATELAAGLVALGLQQEDRVGIVSSTRVEWIMADFAIMLAGGATTTVYPTTQPEEIGYILGDSGSRILVAEDVSQVRKLDEERDRLPDLGHVVLIDGEGDGDRILSWDQLRARGRELLAGQPTVVTDRVAATGPDSLATLIYTSGTTGRPKGVELPHSCWTYEGAAIDQLGILTDQDLQFLWLPLAHSFGKMLLAAQLQIGFPTAVDGGWERIATNLPEVRPTFVVAVPRIYEKIHAGVIRRGTAEGGMKARVFEWAFATGAQASARRRAGQPVSGLLAMKLRAADRLVFSKIKAGFGGRLRYFVSGSAALNRELAEWFDAAGVVILEGYGLTETSAATTMNRPERVGLGTVGEPFPGTEIRVAEDGEIQVRGPGVMRGYRNRPEQTAEVLLEDGWFATGDIGEIDPQGRVRITDRKKDLVKTSGGKYIALQQIEVQFLTICPLVSNILVIANNRNFASALVSLDPDASAAFAEKNGLASTDPGALAEDPVVLAALQEAFNELNTRLNRWETIKEFRVLPRDLTVDDGELTPSLKVKRKVVEDRFAHLVDDIYAGTAR